MLCFSSGLFLSTFDAYTRTCNDIEWTRIQSDSKTEQQIYPVIKNINVETGNYNVLIVFR